MPYGERGVYCLHCGRCSTGGDRVTFICRDCAAVGHRGDSPMGCPVCEREAAAWYAWLDAIAARDEPA